MALKIAYVLYAAVSLFLLSGTALIASASFAFVILTVLLLISNGPHAQLNIAVVVGRAAIFVALGLAFLIQDLIGEAKRDFAAYYLYFPTLVIAAIAEIWIAKAGSRNGNPH